MSELFKADNEYKEWIAGISTDFRRSQIRASMKINDEMLRFYKTVSDDLKSILPDLKSFSPTNLKYMRYFYEMYPDAVICPQVEDELITDANRPQVGDDLQIIFRIPWGHNKIILDKCKGNSAKALFYIRKTIENNWSRDVLLNFLGTDLYERQGKAITTDLLRFRFTTESSRTSIFTRSGLVRISNLEVTLAARSRRNLLQL